MAEQSRFTGAQPSQSDGSTTAKPNRAQPSDNDDQVLRAFFNELNQPFAAKEFIRIVSDQIEKRVCAATSRGFSTGALLVQFALTQEIAGAQGMFEQDTRWQFDYLLEPIKLGIDRVIERFELRTGNLLELLAIYPENARLRALDLFGDRVRKHVKKYLHVGIDTMRDYLPQSQEDQFGSMENRATFCEWLNGHLDRFKTAEEVRIDDEMAQRRTKFLVEREKILRQTPRATAPAETERPDRQNSLDLQPPKTRKINTNARMIDMIQKRPESKAWSSRRWATALSVGKTTIVETPTWRELDDLRQQTKAERALSRAKRPTDRRRR